MIAERLVGLGIPETVLILENMATNTGENVRFGLFLPGPNLMLAPRCTVSTSVANASF